MSPLKRPRLLLPLSCLLLALALLLPAPAFAAADTDLVRLGQQFANDTIGGFLQFIAFFNVGAGTAIGLIQFFAAFTLVYFLVTQINPSSSPLTAFISTALLLGVISMVVQLDWYTFLVHFAPALLAYLVIYDIVGFVGVISERTLHWIAFFSMVLIFWTDYTYFQEGIFGHFFQQIFGTTYSWLANPITIVVAVLFVTVMRVLNVVTGTMRSEAARETQLAFQRQTLYLQQKLMSGTIGEEAKRK